MRFQHFMMLAPRLLLSTKYTWYFMRRRHKHLWGNILMTIFEYMHETFAIQASSFVMTTRTFIPKCCSLKKLHPQSCVRKKIPSIQWPQNNFKKQFPHCHKKRVPFSWIPESNFTTISALKIYQHKKVRPSLMDGK